jgi:hypothetical protein
MGEVRLKFDDNTLPEKQNKGIRVTLTPRCETVIRIPTIMEGPKTGLIEKTEISLGVIVARAITVIREGSCISTVVIMNEEMVEITLPMIRLQECDLEITQVRTILAQRKTTSPGRLRELRTHQDRSHER